MLSWQHTVENILVPPWVKITECQFLCGRAFTVFRILPYLIGIICQRLDLICINIYAAFQRHLLIACCLC